MILVTGGAGFIGSHTSACLAKSKLDFLIVDNFSNSKRSLSDRLAQLINRKVPVIEADVADTSAMTYLLKVNKVSAMIHFAAHKAVGESVNQPLHYYQNNVAGTVALLQAMRAADIGKLVFSSSATVYGHPAKVPICEEFPLSPTNPYGWSKLMIEQVLSDVVTSDPEFWRVACLRYFNPVGAHSSGLIGEEPQGTPNNLMPYVSQVASGQRAYLNIWGKDYPTSDGTGVRDYIHVMDLAEGHLAALSYLDENPGLLTVNLGTGRGISVLEMVKAFERASGRQIPYRFQSRRPGDVAECWADPSLAQIKLNWHATRSLDEICSDAWRWQCYCQGYLKK